MANATAPRPYPFARVLRTVVVVGIAWASLALFYAGTVVSTALFFHPSLSH